jgi:hypothetical protein
MDREVGGAATVSNEVQQTRGERLLRNAVVWGMVATCLVAVLVGTVQRVWGAMGDPTLRSDGGMVRP